MHNDAFSHKGPKHVWVLMSAGPWTSPLGTPRNDDTALIRGHSTESLRERGAMGTGFVCSRLVWFTRVCRSYTKTNYVTRQISDSGFESRIHKELSVQRRNTIRKWAKDMRKYLTKKIHRWKKNPPKDVQHREPRGKCKPNHSGLCHHPCQRG